MEFNDVLPLLPFQPKTLDKQYDLVGKLKEWFKSPQQLKYTLSVRLVSLFEQQYFDDIFNTHQRILNDRLWQAQRIGRELDHDVEFGNVLKGLAQIKLGKDIRYNDPGFKLLTSLVRRKSLNQ